MLGKAILIKYAKATVKKGCTRKESKKAVRRRRSAKATKGHYHFVTYSMYPSGKEKAIKEHDRWNAADSQKEDKFAQYEKES